MTSSKLRYILVLSLVVFQSACKKTDTQSTTFENGVFMPGLGIGGFSVANLSYLNKSTNTVETCLGSNYCYISIFINGMEVFGNRGYLLCQNDFQGHDLKVFSLNDMSLVQDIDATFPKAITFINSNKAYIAHQNCTWPNPNYPDCTPRISILNLQTLQIDGTLADSINIGHMLKLDNGIVLASGDSFIYKFDSNTDQLIDSIPVSVHPEKLVSDNFGMVWTLTSGSQTEPVKLLRINPDPLTIEFESVIPGSISSQWYQFSPNLHTSICTDQSHQFLYWVFGADIYRMDVQTTQIPTTPFIQGNYALVGVDLLDDIIYCSKWSPQDSTGTYIRSYVHRFSSDGVFLDSIQAGIGPVDFCFSTPQ